MPVQPVDASTVILVRPSESPGGNWECFMVRRHVRSDFAADVYVFPGGKVEANDADDALAPYLPVPPAVEGETHDDGVSQALRIAAIREMFEEAGILLATRDNGVPLQLSGAEGERFAGYRSRLQSNDLSMLELARTEGLRYTTDRLYLFSRWITPESMPRRFDTRFFVTRMPLYQKPVHDALETTAGEWISPRDALDRFRQDIFPLVFATEKHLVRLSDFPSIEQIIATSANTDLAPVTPRAVFVNGEQTFLVPGDEGY